MRQKIRKTVEAAGAILIGAQGFAGVACLAAGAFLIAGLGVALVVLGTFLLLGAWASA